jgi:hypothetical protein
VIPSHRLARKIFTEGLVIIGNHYPEFERESVLANLKAVADLNIPYPVAVDNQGQTWRRTKTAIGQAYT